MEICQLCGQQLKTKSALTQHEKYHCKLNPNRQEAKAYREHKQTPCKLCGKLFDVANIKRHEASCGKDDGKRHVNHDGLNCEFCGKLCKNRNSLAQHELRCKENPERKNFDSLVAFNLSEKGLTKETSERRAKMAETLKQGYKSGKIVHAMKGKPGTFTGRKHSEESKAKTRASTLAYIETMYGAVVTRYNVNACRYIEFLNSRFSWHLQHAENGGEVRVCNYFLDGYDSNLNIVFEYDEPRHYKDVNSNILSDKDIERQNYIIEKLGCEFYRYNEALDLLYKVN